MELAGASAVARGVSEYGILGLGWVLFLFSMFYIRVERRRYQDLVIHIITYFTKIHMAEGKDDGIIPPVASALFGTRKSVSRNERES